MYVHMQHDELGIKKNNNLSMLGRFCLTLLFRAL